MIEVMEDQDIVLLGNRIAAAIGSVEIMTQSLYDGEMLIPYELYDERLESGDYEFVGIDTEWDETFVTISFLSTDSELAYSLGWSQSRGIVDLMFEDSDLVDSIIAGIRMNRKIPIGHPSIVKIFTQLKMLDF